MAHEIDMSNARANVAWVGRVPWHGLGQELPEGVPIETWAEAAGLTWEARRSPLFRVNPQGSWTMVQGKEALYRSDTGQDLGIITPSYQIVQPAAVLDFYSHLTEALGFKLEVAGALFGGKKVWALAKTGEGLSLGQDEQVNGYVLLATSYDGTMATVATRTTVRVVCNNTLTLAVGADGKRAEVRIPHNAAFNAEQVRGQLGLEHNTAWAEFSDAAHSLSTTRVSREDAVRFFLDVFYPGQDEIDTGNRIIAEVAGLALSAPGQQTGAASGTAWGLLNAVTFHTDHARKTRSDDSRLNRAWFGDGDVLKRRAFTRACELAGA